MPHKYTESEILINLVFLIGVTWLKLIGYIFIWSENENL